MKKFNVYFLEANINFVCVAASFAAATEIVRHVYPGLNGKLLAFEIGDIEAIFLKAAGNKVGYFIFENNKRIDDVTANDFVLFVSRSDKLEELLR